jgi:hypothetical protein
MRHLARLSRVQARLRTSLRGGRSFTGKTGSGRLRLRPLHPRPHPRQPQRGGGYRRRWIRRRFLIQIGLMAGRPLSGSRMGIVIR